MTADPKDKNGVEARVLRNIIADPKAAARQIAADKKLVAAIAARDINIFDIKAALDDGANPDRVVHAGYSVLQAAVLRHRADVVELLLRYDASVNDVNRMGATAMDEAFRVSDNAIIDILRKAGGKTAVAVHGTEEMVFTGESYQNRVDLELARAVRYGTLREVADAIALGGNPNAPDFEGRYDYTILHLAVSYCHYDKVQKLIAAGGDVHVKSAQGESTLDILWWAGPKKLLSPEWYALFDDLSARGCKTLFSKRPTEMTVDDLRQVTPISEHDADPVTGRGETTLMHRLVENGQGDFVIGVLGRSAEKPLTAQELLRPSAYYDGDTLLDAFSRAGVLDRLFTPEIWQGRLEEMMSLRPHVEAVGLIHRVDFEKAAEDVRDRRWRDFRDRAKKNKFKPGVS